MKAIEEKGHHSMWARIYAARIGDPELDLALAELGDAGVDMAN